MASPRRLSHELGEATGTKVDKRVRARILGRPAALAQQLTDQPDLLVDVAKEEERLQQEAERLKKLEAFNDQKVKEAVDLAVKIAKEIISAMTSDKMREIWTRLDKLLDEIDEQRKARKSLKQE